MSPEKIRELERGATVHVLDKEIGFDDIEVRRAKREGIEVETEGELTVALDTTITAELKEEGMAREFVNRVQNLRKTTGLNVTDRIVIRCDCPEGLKSALIRFREYVCSETLASDIVWQAQDSSMEQVEVDGLNASIKIDPMEHSHVP
jgi:isoleucyl-tRNA synthetase